MLNFLANLFSHPNPKIITAKVVEITPHPNADRLRVVRLNAGSREVYPVVCGATNFNVGDIVALALPGAYITQNIHSNSHEPFVLDKASIRGIESQGMICSSFELGFKDTPETREEGVLVLNPLTPLGEDIHKH